MLSRRGFLAATASAAVLRGAVLTPKIRIDRALNGKDVDRPPFSYWHHFLDEDKPPESHAQSTLAFHTKFRTDLVKVMSDYPYPKPQSGEWYDLKIEENPFPQQIRALELIEEGLNGKVYFIETIFNPWNVAEKLSSPEKVRALKEEKPQKLLAALEIIAESEAHHARRAQEAGADGIFLAIANAQPGVMSEEDYAKFSEPFDKLVLQAASSAPLNVLHLHCDARFSDKLYIDRFYQGWPAAAINYTLYSGIALAEARRKYNGVIMSGLDERKYRSLTDGDLKDQKTSAQAAAGAKLILAPGCSVPNDATDDELLKLPKLLRA
ncbi:MAG TPA: uroporphyrinogen decarboxylase family protein [Bryobacteraceae bacterium]|nr:uroporphyrinogen decarboxylase family protein [Bryobacteraceae bacterium]